MIDEGDHIHVEPRPGIKSKTAFSQGGSGGSGGTGKPAKTKQDQFLDQLFDPQTKPDFSNVRGADGKTKAQREQKPKPSPEKSFLDESVDSVLDVLERGYKRVMRGVVDARMESVGVLPKDISSNLMLLPQDGRLFQTLCSLDDLVQLIIMEPDPYTLVKVHFLRIAGDF